METRRPFRVKPEFLGQRQEPFVYKIRNKFLGSDKELFLGIGQMFLGTVSQDKVLKIKIIIKI